MGAPLKLVCPAGSLPALKTAVDHGADAVYVGFRNATNARNFAGLNFGEGQLKEGLAYARRHGRELLVAINTYAQAGRSGLWRQAIDDAAALGADAVLLADPGLMAYASRTWPQLRLHLSVQGSATNAAAIKMAHECFGVRRAVLPRVLTLQQVAQVIEALAKAAVPVDIEVFGFGSLCVMAEGRCLLSSYATGEAPNLHGVCSPASHVRWENQGQTTQARLNGILIDRFAPDESAGYPTLCKGRFNVGDATYYALEEPTSLNTLALLPELMRIGVAAIKVEGRQRSPAYVGAVTATLRAALDAAARPGYSVARAWCHTLDPLSEGQQQTLGAYSRPWR
ncbi:U32 family peptidase [Chitiniphilus purpureus]|uniref:Ubiquinone biosynthesis protein UbiU n=1 Tax=Chitiniphilus purpureus TaxID=2981137 RepID=A0ABY6DMV0_9NEIS|nr:peptidase U32 family protein [Chitiniphilus sp. CD1]UXY15695.1 U32 family peptidase [Chitiniphilus sp. CD1]